MNLYIQPKFVHAFLELTRTHITSTNKIQIKYRNTKTNTKSTTLKTNLFFHPRQQQQKRQNRIPQYNHYKNNGPSSSFLINVIFCISTTIFSIGILLLYVFYTSSPRRSDWNDNRNNVEMKYKRLFISNHIPN